MEVVKRIIADILYRNLGSYVDGLTKESIGNGIWEGNLELRDLTLKAESLAVLFESFGLDLPVTVTAGYVGLLCVEVPWTNLASKPVRIILTDVAWDELVEEICHAYRRQYPSRNRKRHRAIRRRQ